MASSLDIHVQGGPDVHHVRLGGELDLGTAHQLRDVLVQYVTSSVVLDLSDVSFLDSSGIGVLLSARERIAAEGRDLTIDHASETVRQVLSYSGLAWLMSADTDASSQE